MYLSIAMLQKIQIVGRILVIVLFIYSVLFTLVGTIFLVKAHSFVFGQLDEIQAILKKSRYAQLYVKDRRDAIIMHGICKQWSVDRINDALFSHEEAPLI